MKKRFKEAYKVRAGIKKIEDQEFVQPIAEVDKYLDHSGSEKCTYRFIK